MIIVALKFVPTLLAGKNIPSAIYYLIMTIDTLAFIIINITGFYIVTFVDTEKLNLLKIWKKSLNLVKEHFDTTIVLSIILGFVSWVWGVLSSFISSMLKINTIFEKLGTNTLRYVLLLIILAIISGLLLTLTTYCRFVLIDKNKIKNEIDM